MNTREKCYAVLVGLPVGAALVIELRTDFFWPGFVLPSLGGIALLLLLLVGVLLAVPRGWLRRTSIGYVGALGLIWYLPLNPVERFARDIERVQQGMSTAEVDAIMSGQVKGAFLAGSYGRSVIPAQPHAGQTYFEPQRQHHSFDTYAFVSWHGGHVSNVEVHFD